MCSYFKDLIRKINACDEGFAQPDEPIKGMKQNEETNIRGEFKMYDAVQIYATYLS